MLFLFLPQDNLFSVFHFLVDISMIDSDVDGLTDITVSSVHTSDLSSFEEDTEEEAVMSESMEEGEITSDGKAFYLVKPLGSFLLSSVCKFRWLCRERQCGAVAGAWDS